MIVRAFLKIYRHSWFESLYPVGCAVVAAAACWIFKLEPPKEPSSVFIFLLASSVTFGAIVSGFVGTSLLILTALVTPLMKEIRQTSFLNKLGSYLSFALASGIMLSCTSIVGMWLIYYDWFFSIWCAMFVFCVACLHRLATIMLLIFRSHDK